MNVDHGGEDTGGSQTDASSNPANTSSDIKKENLMPDSSDCCNNGSPLSNETTSDTGLNGYDDQVEDGAPWLVDLSFGNPSEQSENKQISVIANDNGGPLVLDIKFNPTNYLESFEQEDHNDKPTENHELEPPLLDLPFGSTENTLSTSSTQPPALNLYFSRMEKDIDDSTIDLCEQLQTALSGRKDLMEQLEFESSEREKLEVQLRSVEAEKTDLLGRTQFLEAELGKTIQQLKKSEGCREAAEKARAADLDAAASARAILDSQISELKRTAEKAAHDQETIVVRYARSEREVMDCRREVETVTKKWHEAIKERDSLAERASLLASDKSRLSTTLDNKNMELSSCHREIDKLKEELNSRDIKIKWVQNKLKLEMDANKELASTVEKLNEKMGEMQKTIANKNEELDICKKNFDDYETFKILEAQLKEEQVKIIMERHDHSERESKLKYHQSKNDLLIEENNNLSFQVQNLEVERVSLEEKLSVAKAEAQERGNTAADLKSRLVEFDSLSNQLLQEREKVEKLIVEVERLRKTNEELMNDMAACRNREAEMLSFTQKLTTKNVQLQSEFSALEAKVSETSRAGERAEESAARWAEEAADSRGALAAEKEKRESDNKLLARRVAEASARADSLEAQLTEARSEAAGLKNKHHAALKELQRELQQYRKKLEHQEADGKRLSISDSPEDRRHSAAEQLSKSLNLPDALQRDLSAGQLVERILRLQNEIGKRQEKIEFLEEHNAALVAQLQRRGRLLHAYVLREQAGALSSAASDVHKAEMTKHGGIMASLYGSKATDDTMSLELSLEINQKLQAVLEDTLLKNITLKENIDTLGDEIARLKKQVPQASDK